MNSNDQPLPAYLSIGGDQAGQPFPAVQDPRFHHGRFDGCSACNRLRSDQYRQAALSLDQDLQGAEDCQSKCQSGPRTSQSKNPPPTVKGSSGGWRRGFAGENRKIDHAPSLPGSWPAQGTSMVDVVECASQPACCYLSELEEEDEAPSVR